MKILHVIPSISLQRGGPSHAVLNTVRHLRDLGVDSEIVTTDDDGPQKTLDVPFGELIDYKNVPIRFFKRFSPPVKNVEFNADKAFLFSSGMTQWLWKNIQQYDALETRYLFCYPTSYARFVAQLKNVPYVVHPTGQLTPWALKQSERKKQIYSWLIERRNLKRASAIQCSSDGEANDVRDFGVSTPTFTVPVGVDIPEKIADAKAKLHAKYNISLDTTVVLFLSRLHPKKYPELLIHTAKLLSESGKRFHLLLAGSGEQDYVDGLKKLVDTLGVSHHVSFPGFVEGTEKDLLLQGSDIFSLPSFSENFGVAVIEAMASALPVVITPGIQICHDVIRSNSGLVIEGKVELFSEAIVKLIESPELRLELGREGKNLALQKYAWRSIAQQLLSVYDSITQQKTDTASRKSLQ